MNMMGYVIIRIKSCYMYAIDVIYILYY